MSFGWTLAGTIAQLMLGYFLFMLVAFSAGGVVNGGTLSRQQLCVLDLSIYLLPALCVLSAAIVIYLHRHGGHTVSYGWYGMPLMATAMYLRYVIVLSRGSDRNRLP